MVCQIPHPKIENVANDDDMEPYIVNNIFFNNQTVKFNINIKTDQIIERCTANLIF